MRLKGKRITLGLTGGIACYKSAELCRRLMDHGADITVVMTDAACQFITPTTMQALSGNPVFIETLDARMANSMAHINLSREADIILIAPCSADFIAKLAYGHANDLLSTLCLARGDCSLAIAPAMNSEMWAHPATQRNLSLIKGDNTLIWGPDSGAQACGEVGDGRMLEPAQLVSESIAFFHPKALLGKRVLITAGPTEEPIDPVRVISNKSSGKMGYAIAQAAYEAGAQVSLVTGPTALSVPYGVEVTHVQTARQMHQAVMEVAYRYDIFIAVAAVADWYVSNYSDQKRKKQDQSTLDLKFSPNPDILAEVAALPDGPWCLGFAAETDNLSEYAQTKRVRKNIPLIVGNLAQDVMNTDTTTMILFDEQGEYPLPKLSKEEAARHLVQQIALRVAKSNHAAKSENESH